VIALFLGPEPAPEAARRSERLRTETPDPLIQAMILVVEAALIAMQGDITTGEALNRQARTIMAEHDEWIWIVSFWWSFIEMWQSKPDAAERELRPGYEALKKIGSKSHFSSFAHLLASALYEQGRYDEAEQLTRECENAARPNDVHSYIGWRSIRAKILARHGLPDQAEQLAREAITYAATTDFHPAHADALVDLAEVHTIAANPDAARTTLTEAIRLYGKKGNTIAAKRASAHLHRMRSEVSGHQAS
jgi:ATP/maltotriose-dependent transcriptional regulator MalT